MRVLCDLDSICADFFGGIWPEYYRQGGDSTIGTKDVATWDFVGIPQKELIEPIFHKVGFFAGLNLIPGARAGLQLLTDLGHEILIVTSHCTDHSAAEKLSWCREKLPFVPKKNIVITKYKGAIQGQVMIDDSPANCRDFKASNPEGVALTIAYPYNDDDPAYDGRYDGWDDTEKAWMAIVHHVFSISDCEGFGNELEAVFQRAVANREENPTP